jgi:hypothetical protein
MSDLAREIAQTVVRIKSEMRKARFASRSEAGRYAANQRWKNNAKNSFEPNKEKYVAAAGGASPPDDPNKGRIAAEARWGAKGKGKTADDDGLSIRGMTPAKRDADELRTYIDEQEGLLEAMQGSASKAELKQQKGLITLARRDLRRMEGSETKVEPKTPKSNKNISRQEADAIQRVDLFMRSTENLDQSVLDRMAEKYKTGAVSDADRKLLDETKKEMLAAGEAAKTAIQDAFAGGGRSPVDKLGKTFTSSSRKTAKQMVAEGLERAFPTDPKPETTIRGTILQTKRMVFDRLALQLKDIPKALTDSYAAKRAEERMSKGKSFASRSEAGRYAANMRWKGQGQATSVGGQLAGTPQSANVTLVGQVKSPAINASSSAISEGSYEEDEMKVERYLDELKRVGTDILGEKSFGIRFGREIDSIKDRLRDGRYESQRFSPKGSLDRAKVLQEQISEAASKVDFTPRDRMRAEKILNIYNEQKQVATIDRRTRSDYENRIEGGEKVVAAESRERALRAIKSLEKQSKHPNASIRETYGSQYGGAVEVFEALYDEQFED